MNWSRAVHATLFSVLLWLTLQRVQTCYPVSSCDSCGAAHASHCEGCAVEDECKGDGCQTKLLPLSLSKKYSNSKTLKDETKAKKGVKRFLRPNVRFLQCCKRRRLPSSCLPLCSFESYTLDEIKNVLLRINTCPINLLTEVHYCAALGNDHTKCCATAGVPAVGFDCISLCDQRPSTLNHSRPTFSNLVCFERLEEMKSCFYMDSARKHTNE